MAREGEDRHRIVGLDLRAVAVAGVLAGLLFLVLEMLLVPLIGVSPWAPVRMIGAIVMGAEVLPPPASFDASIFFGAIVVHFALSLIYAFVLAFLVRGRSMGMAALIGLAFGLALYLVNFYLFTAFFEWFVAARNWVNVVMHLVFGAVAGAVYVRAARGVRIDRVRRRRYEERPA